MSFRLVHNIGDIKHSNYNTREEILACNDLLGFDGIYKNVYENRDVLKGKKGILFVMGHWVGKDNQFDLRNVPKLEKFCDWNEIMELVINYDFALGWHTWTHSDLTAISVSEARKEITPPFPMDFFAYPYGRYNETVVSLVKAAGFKRAFSVTQGSTNIYEPDYDYKIYRDYLR